MSSVFTKIMQGELPGHFVCEDDFSAAFMSINPITEGHTLVVPRQETDHWIELPAEINAHLMDVAQRIGIAQQQAFSPERIGIIVAGFEVSHMHIHVLPVNSMDDFSFANAAPHAAPEALAAAAQKIRDRL